MDESLLGTRVLTALSKNQNVVVLSNAETHERVLQGIYKAVAKKFKNICVISLDKPFYAMLQKLQGEGMDAFAYRAIELGPTPSKSIPGTATKSIYLSSPSCLAELAVAIETTMADFHPDLIVFHNTSALLTYKKDVTVMRFLHNMMAKIRETKVKAIYSVLQENNASFISVVSLFADAVVPV